MAPAVDPEGFSERWPELADRLACALSARGVAACRREDIIQETALRLFKMWDRVDHSRGAWPLALTIAKNLLWDDVHRRQKREVLGEVADRADPYDVENAGLARVELGRIRRILPSLSPNHRGILLSEVGVPAELEGDPRAIKMLRMRARRRLIALLDRASALGVVTLGSVRSLAWRVQRTFRQEHVAEGCTAVATLVAAAIVGSLVVTADAPEARAATDSSSIVVKSGNPAAPAHRSATRAVKSGAITEPTVVRHRRANGSSRAGARRYDVNLGSEGPAEARLRLELVPGGGERGGRTIVPTPSCKTRTSEREVGAACRARATARDTTVRARARVRARVKAIRGA